MARDEPERLVRGYGGRLLIVSSLAWAMIQAGRFVVPALLPEVRADLSLTLGQAGVILTALYATYAACQYPSGRLSDNLGRTPLIVPSLVVLAVASLLIGWATGFAVLVLGSTVFGIGMGMFAIPSRAMLSDLFVQRRGQALGVLGAGADLGGVIASAMAVVVLAVATWRMAFWPIAVSLFGLALLYAVWTREPFVLKRTSLEMRSTLRRLLGTSSQRGTLLAFSLFYFVLNGVINFLPAYLRAVKGFSPEMAIAGFASLFVLGMGIKPLAGALSDRYPRRWVATAGLLTTAAALTTLIFVGSVLGVIVAILMFALGYKIQFPVVDAMLMDAAPEGSMGGDLGAAKTAFLGIGSLGPSFVGLTADRYDYALAFSVLTGCLLVAVAILSLQDRS